jgi:hypothetical protein
MRLSPIVRFFWHALFYLLAPARLKRYALTCREAVNEMNTTNTHSLRVRLHLSLCQACTNYEKTSQWLRKNIKRSEGNYVDLSKKIFERLRKLDE